MWSRALPILAVIAAIAACDRSSPDGTGSASAGASSPASATIASASAAPSASASPPATFQKPGLHSPKELATATAAELTETGFIALVLDDNSDASIDKPMHLVERSGDRVVRTAMPFSMLQLKDANLVGRRFLFSETEGPKKRMRVWSDGTLSEPIEDNIADGVVGRSQAIVLLGKVDRIQMVSRADLPRAHRLVNGAWRPLTLPAPAEKDFAGCFWDAAVGPGTQYRGSIKI